MFVKDRKKQSIKQLKEVFVFALFLLALKIKMATGYGLWDVKVLGNMLLQKTRRYNIPH